MGEEDECVFVVVIPSSPLTFAFKISNDRQSWIRNKSEESEMKSKIMRYMNR